MTGVEVAIGAGGSALTRWHGAWLGALTGISEPPAEPKATCADCVMCAGVERSGSAVTFSPDVKCCDYVPYLANFIAGRSLLGPGRDSIRARIAGRAGVTPLGLGLTYAEIGRIVAARSQTGGVPEVLCPHFDLHTGGCAIWESRNAVCSTWFCQHERGAVSQRFWHAVRDLLIAVEEGVARACLADAGLPSEQMRFVLAHRAAIATAIARANSGVELHDDTPPDDESADWYAQLWGEWEGREEEWFVRCAESVDHVAAPSSIAPWSIAPASFAPTDAVRDCVEVVRDRWRELQAHDVPDRLVFRPGAGSHSTADELRLVGYSPFDPLVLPARLLADLQRLDGRPIAPAGGVIGCGGMPLSGQVLEQLHDFGVAVVSPA